MRLYLSSYRIGSQPETLAGMVKGMRRAFIITNALDVSQDLERGRVGLQREVGDLTRLGIKSEELDLRAYFGMAEKLRRKIDQVEMLWVVGGNAFVLRRAMQQSGLDQILWEKQSETDFVYSGYSAGVCVITPTLQGLHLVDDPKVAPEGYNPEVIWEGLGMLPYCVAPHYHSDHPDTEMINLEVDYFIQHKILFKALHDGEVIVEGYSQIPN